MGIDFDHATGRHVGADDPTGVDVLLEMIATRAPAWQRDGLCREPRYASVNFFPSAYGVKTLGVIEAARAVCRRCLVVEECAAWAVEHEVPEGVWGGTTPGQRRAMRKATSGGQEGAGAA